MRMNNLSARLIVNERLTALGIEPLSGNLDYTEFATKLRRIRAKTLVQVPFVDRAQAVAYIRDQAHMMLAEARKSAAA